MPQDWFQLNAPAAPAAKPTPGVQPGGTDWFAQNRMPPPPGDDADDDTWLDWIGTTARDVALGAGKSLLRQGIRGGELLRRIPGVNALDNLMEPVPISNETALPQNTAQKVGGAGFEIAQALAPAKAVAKVGTKVADVAAPALSRVLSPAAATVVPKTAVQAAAAGGLSALQGGDATTAAGLTAALPVVGSVVGKVAPKLKAAAGEQVVQALGPTKERFKAMAERIAPSILQRGLGGSREALKAHAEEMLETLGPQIDDAIQQYGARQVGTAPITEALEASKNGWRVTRQMTAQELARSPKLAASAREVRPGVFEADVILDPRPIQQLERLQATVAELGENARVDQLVAVRRAWDSVVSAAGGYAHRAPGAIGMPLKDQSEAAAKREGTQAIRQLLNAEVPELAALNKEFSFWKSLDDVLDQTLKRTAPQGKSLTRTVMEGAGGVMGAIAGTPGGAATQVASAVGLAKLSGMASAAFRSPRWKLASARMKDDLADAIMSGNVSRIANVFGRISANRGGALAADRQ
jgi:hypothetical protein